MAEVLLTPVEARVIAALMEKSIATPQYHPMTVNALMLACNQKTSRSPVMALSEGEVGAALSDLEARSMVTRDESSSRAVKWRQRFSHQMLLKPQPLALLVTLMLRGPQTASELRSNASGIGGPADADGFAAAIQDLSDRAQPLVALLARAPGQKEARYAHLLCGAPAQPTASAEETQAALASAAPRADRLAELEARVATLEQRLAALEASLGVSRPGA